jgi:hypothetical protein
LAVSLQPITGSKLIFDCPEIHFSATTDSGRRILRRPGAGCCHLGLYTPFGELAGAATWWLSLKPREAQAWTYACAQMCADVEKEHVRYMET